MLANQPALNLNLGNLGNLGNGYVLAMLPASAFQPPMQKTLPVGAPTALGAKRSLESVAEGEEGQKKRQGGGAKAAKWRAQQHWPTPGAVDQPWKPVKAASWRCASALDSAAYESQVKSNASGTIRHWPSIEVPTAAPQTPKPQQFSWNQLSVQSLEQLNVQSIAALNASLVAARAAQAAKLADAKAATEKAGAAADALKLLAAAGASNAPVPDLTSVGSDDETASFRSELSMQPESGLTALAAVGATIRSGTADKRMFDSVESSQSAQTDDADAGCVTTYSGPQVGCSADGAVGYAPSALAECRFAKVHLKMAFPRVVLKLGKRPA